LQYPYDADAKCHKGFAFVMLNRNSDVSMCLAKRFRSWFYVEGKPSQGGFNTDGRAYLRVRSAHVEECHSKKDEATHLIFSPQEENVGLRDFKLLVEDLINSMDVTIVKSEGVLDGKNKYVHIHTTDAESAAVVKMFAHQFKENDTTISVRYARKPKVTAAAAVNVVADKKPATVEKKLVLEPITEMTARFGIPYAAIVKGTSSTSTASAAVSKTAASANTVAQKTVNKGKQAPAASSKQRTQLAGTA
jgi:hypothetical protein